MQLSISPQMRPRRTRIRRRAWYALPGTGPAPHLRRRVIAMVPVRRTRRLRWQAGTVLPGVGPTARIQRRSRAVARSARSAPRPAVIGGAALLAAGAAAAAALTKRRSDRAGEVGTAGERTERDAGGPTTSERVEEIGQATGAGHGTKPNRRFEPHR